MRSNTHNSSVRQCIFLVKPYCVPKFNLVVLYIVLYGPDSMEVVNTSVARAHVQFARAPQASASASGGGGHTDGETIELAKNYLSSR